MKAVELFAIVCPTCRTRLKVRNAAAIGQILACPKCASMVQVVPPADWQMPADGPADEQAAARIPHSRAPAASLESNAAAEPAPEPSSALLLSGLASAAILIVGVLVGALWMKQSASDLESVDQVAQLAAAEPELSQPAPSSETSSVAVDIAATVEDQAQGDDPPSALQSMAANADVPDGEGSTDSQSDAPTPDQLHPVSEPEPAIAESIASAKTQHAEVALDSAAEKPSEVAEVSAIDPKHTDEEDLLATTPLRRIPPPQVDVAARLKDPIPSIEFPRITLGRFVDVLSRLSTIPMSFDAAALAELNVSTGTEISVRLKDTTVGDALSTVLANHKLGYTIVENQIVISHPASATAALRRVRYHVGDLLQQDASLPNDFATLVQQMVLPNSWSSRGGSGKIHVEPDALSINQNERAHWLILSFFERLRVARGVAIRSQFPASRFPLATRYARARAALSREVTLNFFNPVPLADVAQYVGSRSGIQLLIDGPALAAEGLAVTTEARVVADRKSLSATIAQLTEPLSLELRYIDARTVQISTATAIARTPELEFYSVENLLSGDVSGPELARRIKERIARGTWVDEGGHGAIHFDAACGHLLVFQSQDVQIQLEKLLRTWKSAADVAAL